jgi:heme exporter protein B
VFRDARLIAAKDLRIEARSRVATNQVLPFAVLVLVLFGIAFDADEALLQRTAPGLYWVAVLLASVLAVQRSFAVEAADDAGQALLLTGLRAPSVFLGKCGALAAQLLVLQAVLAVALAVLLNVRRFESVGWFALVAAALAGTIGIAAAGTLYGALSAGQRVRDSLLPLLLLPILVPVLIAATRAFEAAMQSVRTTAGPAQSATEAWPWIGLLAVFAAAYVTAGTLAFGAIHEDS